jgi:lysophospholipase L1-like esterase
MPKKSNIFLFMFSLTVSILIVEASFFVLQKAEFQSYSARYYFPYIGFGDFRALNKKQMPEAFDYRSDKGTYVYNSSFEIQSIAQRFSILFENIEGFGSIDSFSRENLVFVMGASAALGDGHVRAENRFPLQIQKNLRELLSNEKIQILPAAIRAFVSIQERILLDLFVLPHQPKAIVFLHGFNDSNQWESMVRPGDPYNLGIEYSRQESKWFRTKQFLAEWSYFFQWFFRRSAESSIYSGYAKMLKDPKAVQNYTKSMANIYVENVFWMAKRCEQEKVYCLFVLQPAYIESQENRLPAPYSQIKKVLAKSGPLNEYSAFLDFSDRYSDRRELFVDTVHLIDEGQMLLAKEVVEQATPFLKNAFANRSASKQKVGKK